MPRNRLNPHELSLEEGFIEESFTFASIQGRQHESSSIYPMGFRAPSPLHIAARDGNARDVMALIESGADLNARALGDGYTPLMFAAQNGYGDIVQLLVDGGADIHIKTNRFHKSALSEAARYHYPMIAAFLLSRGANPADLDSPEFSCVYTSLISCLEYGIRLWDPSSCRDYNEPTDPAPVIESRPQNPLLGEDNTNTNPDHLE